MNATLAGELRDVGASKAVEQRERELVISSMASTSMSWWYHAVVSCIGRKLLCIGVLTRQLVAFTLMLGSGAKIFTTSRCPSLAAR